MYGILPCNRYILADPPRPTDPRQEKKVGEDVFAYWHNGDGVRFPLLRRVAQKILCIPASSAPSERVFSHSGYMIHDRRSRLLPSNVNASQRIWFALKEDPAFFSEAQVQSSLRLQGALDQDPAFFAEPLPEGHSIEEFGAILGDEEPEGDEDIADEELRSLLQDDATD